MQWQLIPETTMHAFDINALLTMIAINKLPEMTANGHNVFFPNVKAINAAIKTHAAVPEKLTINFFLPNLFMMYRYNTCTFCNKY
jgi:hypothetical protein